MDIEAEKTCICITEDVEAINENVRKIINLFGEAKVVQIVGEKFQSRVGNSCEYIKTAVDGIVSADNDEEKKRLALIAICSISVIDSEVEYIASQVKSQGGGTFSSIAKAISSKLNILKSIIQTVSRRIWQLISHLITPQSWTVSGGAGVGLFGLTGNVNISITFG